MSEFMSSWIGRVLSGTATVLFTLTIALPALAVDAMFTGSIHRIQYGYYTTFAASPRSLLQYNPGFAVAATQGAPSPRGFTIPSKAFDAGIVSYTAMFPGYPFFSGYRTRFMTSGSFTRDFKVPNTSYTIRPQTNQGTAVYPNALPGTVPLAYMKIKVGSNGFGGYWGVNNGGTLQGIASSFGGGGGFSDFYFRPNPYGAVVGIPKGLDHDGGKNNWPSLAPSIPLINCCAYSKLVNQTSPMINLGIMFVRYQRGHFTGTATVSGPEGGYATKFTYSGMDSRTPLGLNGTISLVAPGIFTGFLLNIPPTFTGNTPVQLLNLSAPLFVLTDLTFVPEPSQWFLLATGVTGLLALRRLMGRR